jgi:hypothetical protein
MTTWKLQWIAPFVLALGMWLPAHRVAAEEIFIVAPSVPEEIDSYPSVDYEGRPVYYWHGRWYYRHGEHWVYYRETPRYLHEHHERQMVERERVREHEHEHEHERHEAVREHEVHEAHEAHEARDAHEAHQAERAHEVRGEERHDRRDRRERHTVYVAPRAN